eukprot:81659-Alexandrium_andersonii.AAC.1
MSASLVGSEMCIRDRLGAIPAPGACVAGPAPPRRARGRAWATARRWAVSYTHLTLPTICSV